MKNYGRKQAAEGIIRENGIAGGKRKICMSHVIQLKSVITCPSCGFRKEELMPEDSCRILYECENCGAILRPRKGDCCVFCSYGSVDCPPVQRERSCCRHNAEEA